MDIFECLFIMPPPIIRWHEDVCMGKITNLGNLHTEILHLLSNPPYAKQSY